MNKFATSKSLKQRLLQGIYKDELQIRLVGGKGGSGGVSFARSKTCPRGRPDGGDGGRGGNIIFVANKGLSSLNHLPHVIKAKSGANGGPNHKSGENGPDIRLAVPLGTLLRHSIPPHLVIADLVDDGTEVIVCRGGSGGRGNYSLGLNNHECEKGRAGEEISIELSLRTIADISLVGFPNAGKSSLLAALTRARPQIAPFPFTTLNPFVGMLDPGVSIADIPGLIEGAHKNRGLGHRFLKHVEKTRSIVLVIDGSRPVPSEDVSVLMDELEIFNPTLPSLVKLIVLNKSDLSFGTVQGLDFKVPVVQVSAVTGEGIEALAASLRRLAGKGYV